jgi:hypothetical protein
VLDDCDSTGSVEVLELLSLTSIGAEQDEAGPDGSGKPSSSGNIIVTVSVELG